MKKPNQNFTATNQISGVTHKEIYINMNRTHKNMITEVTSSFAWFAFSKWFIPQKAAQVDISHQYTIIIVTLKTTLLCTFKEASSTTQSYLNLWTLMSACLVCVFNTGYNTQTEYNKNFYNQDKWKYNNINIYTQYMFKCT